MERYATPSMGTSPRRRYQLFLETFKHPSCQPVVREVRDFISRFPKVVRAREGGALAG